jgi:hypothetical protein
MTLPDAAHAGGRDRQAAPLQRFRHAHPPPGRLIDRHSHHRLLDLAIGVRFFKTGLRRLISCSASSPPLSYSSDRH